MTISSPSLTIDELVHPSDPQSLVMAHGSPLLVLDCNRIRAQYRQLTKALPQVGIHYAMKALPHPAVLATLHAEGSGFDVASSGEIAPLRRLNVSPDKWVHTHPIKRDCDIREGLENGCNRFVIDNLDEMLKFVAYRENVSLLLRVGFPSIDAAVDLSKKFGCAPDSVYELLTIAKTLGLRVTGLSFHVGSQCASPRAHLDAISQCCTIIEYARNHDLTPIRLLDIGGGFPAPYQDEVISIEEFAKPIVAALGQVPSEVRVIAEPGRFIAAPAMTAITTVVGKARRGPAFWYYLDDGVFGSFNGRVYDQGAQYPIKPAGNHSSKVHPSVLAGPTCDSIDVLEDNIRLPELEIGDLLVADFMGAYTTVCASDFNSLPKAKILVLNAPTPGYAAFS